MDYGKRFYPNGERFSGWSIIPAMYKKQFPQMLRALRFAIPYFITLFFVAFAVAPFFCPEISFPAKNNIIALGGPIFGVFGSCLANEDGDKNKKLKIKAWAKFLLPTSLVFNIVCFPLLVTVGWFIIGWLIIGLIPYLLVVYFGFETEMIGGSKNREQRPGADISILSSSVDAFKPLVQLVRKFLISKKLETPDTFFLKFKNSNVSVRNDNNLFVCMDFIDNTIPDFQKIQPLILDSLNRFIPEESPYYFNRDSFLKRLSVFLIMGNTAPLWNSKNVFPGSLIFLQVL